MLMMILSGVFLFIAAVIFYWLVAKPLAELPTYEELKAAEELAKK